MTRTLYNLISILLLSFLTTCYGCSNDSEQIPIIGDKMIVLNHAKVTHVELLAPKDTSIYISSYLTTVSNENILAYVDADFDLVDEYNKANNTAYKGLQIDAFNIKNNQLILPRYNEKSSRIELQLLTEPLKDSEQYLLPLRINKIKGDNLVELNKDSTTVFFIFSKKAVKPIPFMYLKDIELTTEIGKDKKNWFSAFANKLEQPYTFSVEEAKSKSEMMDFALVIVDDGPRFAPSIICDMHANTKYDKATRPYIEGFKTLTYLMNATHNTRYSPTLSDFNAINSYSALQDKIEELTKKGYNYPVADRTISVPLKEGLVLVQGWGPNIANNKDYALVYLKEVKSLNGGKDFKVKFDIKFFGDDVRTKYSSSSIDNPYLK